MFWILATISCLGYSLNALAVAYFSRKITPFSAGVYRNLSLGISFLPLVVWVGLDAYTSISLEALGLTLLSSFIMVAAVYFETNVMRIMPVGVYIGIQTVFKIIFTSIVAYFFLSETLGIKEIMWISLAVCGAFVLGMSQPVSKHLAPAPGWKKILYIILIALSLSIGFPILAKASRIANPIAIAHVWEFSIGVFGLGFILLRQITGGKGLHTISLKTLGKVLLFCSPTVLGTGGFALASTHGEVAILTAVGVSIIALSALLSAFIFHEKLKLIQIISIGIIMLGIIGLALWS